MRSCCIFQGSPRHPPSTNSITDRCRPSTSSRQTSPKATPLGPSSRPRRGHGMKEAIEGIRIRTSPPSVLVWTTYGHETEASHSQAEPATDRERSHAGSCQPALLDVIKLAGELGSDNPYRTSCVGNGYRCRRFCRFWSKIRICRDRSARWSQFRSTRRQRGWWLDSLRCDPRVRQRRSARGGVRGVRSAARCGVTRRGADGPARRSGSVSRRGERDHRQFVRRELP